jgi:exosortase H (IPTLxxWG-CTERM-specific)
VKRRRQYRKRAKSRLADVVERRLVPLLARHRAVIRSVSIFAGVVLASFLALPLYLGFIDGPLCVGTARVTGFILRILGTGVRVTGTVVSAPAFSMEVIAACTGAFAFIIFAAAVLAYPCRLTRKAIGIGLGVPAIFAVNMVRMVSLFYIGAFLPGIFETAHLFFWQSLMIVSAVLIWLFWAQRLTHARKS